MNAAGTNQGSVTGFPAPPVAPMSGTSFGDHKPGTLEAGIWRLALSRSLPRRWKKRLRKLATRLFPGPFDISAAGFNWRLYPETNYCDRVLFARRRLPEVEERAALLGNLGAGEVFVDVGANIGTYTLDAANRVGPHGRVLAIEPNPRIFERLMFHILANGAGNIAARAVAIAASHGIVRLWRNGGTNVGNSSLLAEGAGKKARAVEVPAMPLTELLRDERFRSIAAMKIDVEGFEDRVIVPLIEAGDRSLWPKRIQIETVHRSLWQDDCLARLKAVGYRTVLDTGENEILERAD